MREIPKLVIQNFLFNLINKVKNKKRRTVFCKSDAIDANFEKAHFNILKSNYLQLKKI